MTAIYIPEEPGGAPDLQAGAIRAPASSPFLAIPAVDRANWLLAARQGLVFQGAWGSAVEDMDSRVYHNVSENCQRILILALIERSTSLEGGTITVTADNGTADPVSYTQYDTTATTRFTSPTWTAWYTTAKVENSGIRYHEVEWSDLIVRSLTIMEMPRDQLDPDSDLAVAHRDGNYAGFLSRRMITDGTDGGIPDLLAATQSARDDTKRHVGGIIMPDADAWTVTSTSWTNLADADLGTSGFGFRHKAREIRDATVSEEYAVRIRARYTGNGGDVRVRSTGTSDSVTFSYITGSWNWYAPDSSATLDVDADADDTLPPEAIADDGTSGIEVSSVQIIPV